MSTSGLINKDTIRQLAIEWRDSPDRPRVKPATLAYWNTLVEAWVESDRMPLLLRKKGQDATNAVVKRGYLYHHTLSGRPLVHVDNAPANWCLSAALEGYRPTLAQVLSDLEKGKLPIAMILKADERKVATYRGTQRDKMFPPNLNAEGWRVCHIRTIGLDDRRPATELPLDLLKAQMRLLLHPGNMFVVQKTLGLGENPDFIEVFGDADTDAPGGST